ncbi:MAG: pyridoxal phosphate-dependent aminotransferase [Pseudomonadales bacterium]
MTDPDHRVARNVATARVSAIKEMAMRSAGIADVASLAWGLPSFATPSHIRDAAARALAGDPDSGKYALPNGLRELRVLAAAHYRERTGMAADPDANLFISAGNMQGVHSVLRALVDPGDEVILTDPGFASHYQQVRLCGGTPVPWRLEEARGWALDLDTLDDCLTPRSKALILVSPSNPTGSVFRESQLRQLGDRLNERGVVLIVDDPYSDILLDGSWPFFNPAAQPALADSLVYLFTFSKIHAMSGWRVGYMVLPDWLRGQVLKVHDATMICTPRISQIAAIAALGGDQSHVAEFRDVLARRGALICERLDRLPHLFDYVRPQGAYYVFPRIHAPHQDSFEFALRLLEQIRVSVTPGSAFGPSGEHHVRMAFCVAEDVINLAFDRLERHFPA